MKLEQSFEVAAPVEVVWRTLIDVEQVAPCLPGAAVTGQNDDGSYNGTFSVKIGPTSASYTGKLEMTNVDEAARTATMQANGTDKRGQGGAKATIISRLSAAGGARTRVDVVTDYHITGRLARFGRGGMIEDISERLLRDFARCLQSSLVGVPDGGGGVGSEDGGAGGPAVAASEGGSGGAGAEATAGGEAPTPGADAQRQPTGETSAPTGPGRPPHASEPIEGLSLVASVLWKRARSNPQLMLAAIAGFLLALVVFRRGRR